MGWIFNRTPKEPDSSGSATRLPRRVHTSRRAGWSVGGRPGREHPDGWGRGDGDDRNSGEDVTRKRAR